MSTELKMPMIYLINWLFVELVSVILVSGSLLILLKNGSKYEKNNGKYIIFVSIDYACCK